jgi:hypothetical protein
MSRAVLGTVVLAGAAVAGVLLLGRPSAQRPIIPTAPLTVRAFFAPQTVQFGDRLTARVVVLADRSAVRAGSVRITDGFAPLTQLGAARTTRTQHGRLDVVSVDVPTACLAQACTRTTGRTLIALPQVIAKATTTRGRTLRASVPWPRLNVTSRVTAADLDAAKPPFRAETLPSAPHYRIGPDTLALMLDGVAAALAAAAAGLAAWGAFSLMRRQRPVPMGDELELALRRMREAQARPAPERRRALGVLSRLLDPRDRRLAGAARELAWSEHAPEPEALSALASRVERTEET